MNDELIGLLGQFSKELLGDDRFKTLVQMYGQQCAADMLETKPEHYKQREYIHASFTGFQNFVALVQKFAQAFDKLYPEEPIADIPGQYADDPNVHDIYSE